MPNSHFCFMVFGNFLCQRLVFNFSLENSFSYFIFFYLLFFSFILLLLLIFLHLFFLFLIFLSAFQNLFFFYLSSNCLQSFDTISASRCLFSFNHPPTLSRGCRSPLVAPHTNPSIRLCENFMSSPL